MSMSLKERDRRYSAIRKLMGEGNLDCLVITSRDTFSTKGNVRYVANYGNFFGQATVFFPVDGDPSIICSGAHAVAIKRGGWIENIITINSYHQNVSQEVEAIKKELARLDRGNKIGVVGRSFISVPVYLAIEGQCLNRVVDSADIINQLRDAKSPEEIEAVRTAALIADKVFIHIKNMVRPGLTDYEIYGEAKALIHGMGCEYSMELMSGLPYGRIFGANDIASLEITPAYDGYYAQIPAGFPVAGEYPSSMNKVIGIWEEALATGVNLLRPGKKVSELHEAISTFRSEHGDSSVGGRMGHSLGLDVIDTWDIIPTNTTELKSGMTLIFHPGITLDGVRVGGGYTYLITDEGAEKLSKIYINR